MRKYAALTAIAVRHEFSQRGAVLARGAFYVLILYVFSRLWEAVLGQGPAAGFSSVEALWYLAATEWVVLSWPVVHLEIERDVRSGDIVYQMCRPVSYLGAQFAQAVGTLAVRMLLLGGVGFAAAWTLAGSLPPEPGGLLLALPVGALAGLAGTLFSLAIGLTAVWIQDVNPVSWIWQKLAFVLGGLMLPLDLYPEWLRDCARWTPFHAMLYGPGHAAMRWDPAGTLETSWHLGLWILVGLGLCTGLFRRAGRSFAVNGG